MNTRLGEKSAISGSCQDDGLELVAFFSVSPGKAIEEREPWTQVQQCTHKAAGCTELVNRVCVCVCVCVCVYGPCGQMNFGPRMARDSREKAEWRSASSFDIFLELP